MSHPSHANATSAESTRHASNCWHHERLPQGPCERRGLDAAVKRAKRREDEDVRLLHPRLLSRISRVCLDRRFLLGRWRMWGARSAL